MRQSRRIKPSRYTPDALIFNDALTTNITRETWRERFTPMLNYCNMTEDEIEATAVMLLLEMDARGIHEGPQLREILKTRHAGIHYDLLEAAVHCVVVMLAVLVNERRNRK